MTGIDMAIEGCPSAGQAPAGAEEIEGELPMMSAEMTIEGSRS
jgi:hypothetical protein